MQYLYYKKDMGYDNKTNYYRIDNRNTYFRYWLRYDIWYPELKSWGDGFGVWNSDDNHLYGFRSMTKLFRSMTKLEVLITLGAEAVECK